MGVVLRVRLQARPLAARLAQARPRGERQRQGQLTHIGLDWPLAGGSRPGARE